MKYLIVSVYTLGAWLAHAAFLQLYINRFESVKSIAFRSVHLAEIAIVFTVAMVLYVLFASGPVSTGKAIFTVLITLIVADAAVFAAVPSLREKFDLWHFVSVYVLVTLVVLIIFGKARN